MGADYFFRMGSTHAICQDYALAGELDGRSYALLADGCSGVATPGQPGSPYTDFGARFLVRATQRRLENLALGDFPIMAIVEEAARAADVLKFSSTALDATLLAAVSTPEGDVRTFQMGDGVIAWRKRDGTVGYRTLEFGNGMPFYPSYVRDGDRLAVYLHPDDPAKAEDAGFVTFRENVYVPGHGWTGVTTRRETVFAASGPITGVWTLGLSRATTDVVLLLSDGVETFQTKTASLIPLEEVLLQLFDFKGFVGQFLVRRCTRFMQKFCAESGWHHADDFSAAGIYLGDP